MSRFPGPLALLLFALTLLATQADAAAQVPATREVRRTESFAFEVGETTLVGLLDRPTAHEPLSTILLVHGYGETRVVEEGWFLDLRSHFARLGMNVLVWDKPGCGKSEGEFDIDQPVASSAEEVVAAVAALREREIPGTEQIGLWGISRAGWIAPLAMQAEPLIDFWISVSGTDDKENGRYLLTTNWAIEGRTPEEVELLTSEWQRSFDVVWQGGSYEDYIAARKHLVDDPFMQLMGWAANVSEEAYYAYQRRFESGELTVDEDAGLMVYVPGFEAVLASIDRPVLAIFGERDTNVNWRSTAELYRATLGTNASADLTVEVFPEGNHSLKQCETGGVREMRGLPWNAPYADGYYETMAAWLVAFGFGAD